MQINLDERRVEYFQIVVEPRVDFSVEQIVNALFRTYLEQTGAQFGKSYAAWLEERLDGTPPTGQEKAETQTETAQRRAPTWPMGGEPNRPNR